MSHQLQKKITIDHRFITNVDQLIEECQKLKDAGFDFDVNNLKPTPYRAGVNIATQSNHYELIVVKWVDAEKQVER